MLMNAIAAGLRAIGSRPGLAALLFLLNLALALVLAVPVGTALDLAVSGTGFDADLARGLDIVLLADILGDNPDFFAVLVRQLVWLLPLMLVWNAAQGAGLVHALRGDAQGSFWEGVGRHFRRVLGLTALYAVMAGIVILLAVIVGSVIQAVSGEKWTVLGWTVIFPIMLVVGLAKLDMMQDYGRIAIVHGGFGVFRALFSGRNRVSIASRVGLPAVRSVGRSGRAALDRADVRRSGRRGILPGLSPAAGAAPGPLGADRGLDRQRGGLRRGVSGARPRGDRGSLGLGRGTGLNGGK